MKFYNIMHKLDVYKRQPTTSLWQEIISGTLRMMIIRWWGLPGSKQMHSVIGEPKRCV